MKSSVSKKNVGDVRDAVSEVQRFRGEMESVQTHINRLSALSLPAGSGERRKIEKTIETAGRLLDDARTRKDMDEEEAKVRRKQLRKTRKSLAALAQRLAIERITQKSIPKDSVFIGVDLGGTNAQVAAVSARGEVLASAKVVVAGASDEQAVVSLIADQTRETLRDAGVAWERVQGVGIGAAGTIDFEKGAVVFAPNLNWRDVPVQSLLQERLGVPVYLDNDVNVGTLGEWALGAGQGLHSVVGIFWGTGIGGGLIINGHLIRGANGMAAEVGHVVVDPRGPKCGCGNQGCMEAIAGRRSITREIRAAIRRGETTLITTLVGRDPKIIRSGALREAVKQKDPVTMRVLRSAAEAVGMGIANTANMIDPDAFIIGGGVVEALGDWIVEHAAKAARKDLICADRRELVVLTARLGDNGGSLGAAILAMQKWEPKRTGVDG